MAVDRMPALRYKPFTTERDFCPQMLIQDERERILSKKGNFKDEKAGVKRDKFYEFISQLFPHFKFTPIDSIHTHTHTHTHACKYNFTVDFEFGQLRSQAVNLLCVCV